MRIHIQRWPHLLVAYVLLVAACSVSDADTTSDRTSRTTGTTSGTTTATSSGGDPPASGTTLADIPDTVVETTVDFGSSLDPKIKITVEVSTTVDDDNSWIDAGRDGSTFLSPEISGSEYWVRFTIEPRDGLGTVTELAISGTDGVLGSEMCSESAPIAPAQIAQCVVGPFPLLAGDQVAQFDTTASGLRQSYEGSAIIPPLVDPGYLGAPITYQFLFEESGEPILVSGRASGSTVDLSPVLDVTVSLDCDSPGEGTGLTVVGYGIISYDNDGQALDAGSCVSIPMANLSYNLDTSSDLELRYTGV